MDFNEEITHVGFSDESNWNVGRFRSLGLVTMPVEYFDDLRETLHTILRESGIKEFKWKELRGAKERFAAIKMCEFAVDAACAGTMRLDVLIWDTDDSRHKVKRRDDTANLQRMHYHLFRNVLRVRWPDDAIWRLYPDEHTSMDWQTVEDCLDSVSAGVELESSLFTGRQFRLRLRREFEIQEIREEKSSDQPLLQLADLFAGLAVFSRDKFTEYQEWRSNQSGQLALLKDESLNTNPSRSSQERFQVLYELDRLCKSRSLQVSLKSSHGLQTPNPQRPINFWLYQPQHPKDRAPVRE